MQRESAENASYWSQTKRPLPCLVFVLPILLIYELGVIWLGGDSVDLIRTGADLWSRRCLCTIGLTDRWLPPLLILLALLSWQVADPRQWRFSPGYLAGMAVESVLLAVALVGLSKLVDLGFQRLEGTNGAVLATPGRAATFVGFLGAGVYEETLFRLALIPLSLSILKLLQTPKVIAGTIAVTGSALLFSIAHHVGAPGDTFSWFVFVFRWLAGVYFAWVFVARGFGVAVGAHAVYDIIVGWLGWHF